MALGPMNNLSRISELLSLSADCQDWGIENSDGSRLVEFIEFAENLVPENTWELEGVIELVMESFEDVSEGQQVNTALRDRMVQLVRARGSDFPVTLAHWRSHYSSVNWRFMSIIHEALGA
jgi:hypothetical protein